MRGKVGLVIGLAAGYVLGTRAGRERYEQIKTQALRVWHLDPVQNQVTKAKEFAKERAMALPAAVWAGAVKVTRAAGGSGTPGQKLDAALAAGEESAADIEDAAAESAAAARAAVADLAAQSRAARAKAED